MISLRQNDFSELRETLHAMMNTDTNRDLAWVIGQLLDLGYIVPLDARSRPTEYVIEGLRFLDDVEHLIATIGNYVAADLALRIVTRVVSFSPTIHLNKPDLLFRVRGRLQ